MIKRLYRFILKSFLPQFAMTFFIVLFIVLMQFLWRYIDDLVGKGLSFGVLAELFFYAALSMVPMALPLAILLASLMTFGNLGEKSELTAIKASGVPLIKTMSPLIVLVGIISIAAFFFQNDVLPKAQVKMWTLLFSARQKSPELEIPEGSFYDQIPGYNLYVKHKDRESGMLYGVMIYDVSRGGDNSTILLADTAQLAFAGNMKYLYLHLRQGEQFENLREQRTGDRNVPFRRETFYDKEILIPFDANFNRLGEEGMRNQYVGKNISELRVTIDSITGVVDSLGYENMNVVEPLIARAHGEPDPLYGGKVSAEQRKVHDATPPAPVDLDSLIETLNPQARDALFTAAMNNSRLHRQEAEFRAVRVADEKNRIRRHDIELTKKFTLSVACLLFLFIGAPLGAIIRKGGLGMPLVISVFIFIFYYIIDNTGYKMARDGRVEVWCGIWLSTLVLLPLGAWVTIKAMNDSSVFNADLYREWARRVFGLPEKRHVPLKDVIINDIDLSTAQAMLLAVGAGTRELQRVAKYDSRQVAALGADIDVLADYLGDSRDLHVIDLLNKLPVLKPIWIYRIPLRITRRRLTDDLRKTADVIKKLEKIIQ